MTYKSYKKQRGMNLVELMIAMAVSLVLMSGLIYIFAGNIGASSDNIKTARLNQELRGLMSVMTKDIRNAGYMGRAECTLQPSMLPDVDTSDCPNGAAAQINPFQDITISNKDYEGQSEDKITFSYDLDSDGEPDANDENRGYWLDGTTLKMRYRNQWWSFSDPDAIKITDFSLNWVTTESDNVLGFTSFTTKVEITLTGELKSDSSTTRTIVETVRIKNDSIGGVRTPSPRTAA